MPKKSHTQQQRSSSAGSTSKTLPSHSSDSPPTSHVNTASPTSYAAIAHHAVGPEDIPSPPHSTFDDEKERLQQHGYDLVGAAAIDSVPAGKPYATGIASAPWTVLRAPYVPSTGDALIDPGTARATAAASREAPNGTVEGGWAREHQEQTVLQQHVAYWDTDADGVIWPRDTYAGCRRWGWSRPLCLVVAALIHVGLAWPTQRGWLPDPLLRIRVDRLHRAKHGSDSQTFDNEGRFRPQNFEDFFEKYDEGRKGGLDWWDLLWAWWGQRLVFDAFGIFAAFLEWFATYLLLWPHDGVMRKDDVRRVFDGSIFQHKADEYAKYQRQQRQVQPRMESGVTGAWWSKAA